MDVQYLNMATSVSHLDVNVFTRQELDGGLVVAPHGSIVKRSQPISVSLIHPCSVVGQVDDDSC